ncbi:hypothetical protein VMCG_03223 [Cytospora schulzeri]|uniref:Uncharacterized protein n=1 Tax=Cytospora schulzeri TaxID=448051 RepID=A0A423WXT7_9PEZI|nr:hypothetical protein VMCG_03223 [Valsa malicola]
MNRLSILLFLLGALASLAAAASAPTFCKCTCFTNSTIIEIKSKSSTTKSSTPDGSSSLSSSHLKLPSEGDTDNNDDEPALDPRSVLLDFDDEVDMSDLLFSPSHNAQRQDQQHHTNNNNHNSRRRSSSNTKKGSKRAHASPSCNQCNKAFCLSQSLPICKDAADKDVVTMCFQRDSRKDQIIVWGFILGTAGLLGWAGVQKVMAMREQGSFLGIPGIGGRGGPGVLGGLAREGVRVGAARVGATGSDVGRGTYAAVGGHSRDSSIQTGIGG